VAYDRLAESLRLIDGEAFADPVALSRRRRFAPLAVDVDGDVAVTLFVRRGVSGRPELESWTFERRAGLWACLGGGGGGYSWGDPLAARPGTGELGAPARVMVCGWTARRRRPRFSVRRRGVSYLSARVAREVATIRVGRDRRIRVPGHGNVVVCWGSPRAPSVELLDMDGRSLGFVVGGTGRFDVVPEHRQPGRLHRRVALVEARCRRPRPFSTAFTRRAAGSGTRPR
jgi:hypothetical protein